MKAKTCILILCILIGCIQYSHQQQECHAILDLVFAIDGSNSMGNANFQRLKDSLANLIRSLRIGPDEIRVGLVLFSRTINAVVNLTGDKDYLINELNSFGYPDEETRTDLAIDECRTMVAEHGRNNSAPDLLMILTDGVSTEPNLTIISSTKAKDQGINIFAIGITNLTDKEELMKVASSRNQVVITEDFTTLEDDLNNATYRACVDLQPTPTPTIAETTPTPTITEPTPTPTTTEPTPTPTSENTAAECHEAKIDIAFILDCSSNIGASNFTEMKAFVHDFLLFADVDTGEIRVAVLTYGDSAQVQFNLNTHSTKSSMDSAISSLQYVPGGSNLADAMKALRFTVFTKTNGDRPDVPNVAILLSANDVNVNTAQAIEEADITRGAGIQIYGIAIGHGSSNLIDGVVTRPVEENRFLINTSADLRPLIGQVYSKFNKFCETPPPVPACYMGQTDLWFVVDVSRTSESLSRVQSTGDFQDLKRGLTELIKIVQDPSVSNPGVRMGIMTYSDTSRIASDISGVNSVNRTASAVQQIPGGLLQGGASLVPALKNIVMPAVPSGYRSYVAIVAPESSYTTSITSLGEEFTRLKSLGYTIVIFAVRDTGALDQNALEMSASGSKFFYRISRYSELEAAAKNFTRDRLCNGRIETSNGLCAYSGHRENGVGVVVHPFDCDKYIQCYYDETENRDLGVIRQCPIGLHWSSINETCTKPSEAKCPYDKCQEECSDYKMEGSCSAYWACMNGTSVQKCCQQNYTFIPELGCQLDYTCTDACGTEKWCGKCLKKPNWKEPSGYDVKVMGGNVWIPRPCFYKDFDIVHCDCSAPRDKVCNADMVYDFTDDETIKAIFDGVKDGIRVSDVKNNSEGISLGMKSAVHVKVDGTKGEMQAFTVEFRFRELETFSPYGETLLSSGLQCAVAHNLLISANDQFIIAQISSPKGLEAEVKVPTKGLNEDDFKNLLLSYNMGVLALSIEDESTQYIAKTNAPSGICLSCGLDIGEGLNKLSFNGNLQKVAVYSCAWPLLYWK